MWRENHPHHQQNRPGLNGVFVSSSSPSPPTTPSTSSVNSTSPLARINSERRRRRRGSSQSQSKAEDERWSFRSCVSSVCCLSNRWTVVRVGMLFVMAVVVLLIVYKARASRMTEEAEKDARRNNQHLHLQHANGKHRNLLNIDLNDVINHDRWVVVSVDEDVGRKKRDVNASSAVDYACALVDASVTSGWRPLVIAEELPCCNKPACVLLHNVKRAQQFFHILPYLDEVDRLTLRNLAFLYAIQHRARYVYDAYSEPYSNAGISAASYRREAIRQFRRLTLDVSLGLIYERPFVRRVYNPYAHFGRPDLWTPGYNHRTEPNRRSAATTIGKIGRIRLSEHMTMPTADPFQLYRICEARPPSMEKFLEVDSNFMDSSAPSIVLPGDTVAPFSTRNTLYATEAFWALPLLPMASPDVDVGNESRVVTMDSHLFRGLWNHALLGDIAGSVKLSLSALPTLDKRLSNDDDPDSSMFVGELSALLLKWRCRTRSTLLCMLQLARDLHAVGFLEARALPFLEAWVADLRRIGYLEPPMVPRRRGHANPCLGADGLYGVSFYPAMPPPTSTNPRRNVTLLGYMQTESRLEWIKKVRINHDLATQQKRENLTRDQRSHSPSSPSVGTHRQNRHYYYQPTILNVEESPPPPVSDSEGSMPDNQNDSVAHGSSISDDMLATAIDEVVPEFEILQVASDDERTWRDEQSADEEIDERTWELARESADDMCLGFSNLLPFKPKRTFPKILLIISFASSLRYDQIPLLETIYRAHFPNILYCGAPHESIEIYLRKYQTVENRSFAFLPTHSKMSYECVLGALEMGYHRLDGYLVVRNEALLNTWNLVNGADGEQAELNKRDWKSTWYTGNNPLFSHKISAQNRKESRLVDPGGQKLKRGVEGLVSSFRFFAYLLGAGNNKTDDSFHDDYSSLKMSSVRRKRDEASELARNETTSAENTTASSVADNVENEQEEGDEAVVLKAGTPYFDLILNKYDTTDNRTQQSEKLEALIPPTDDENVEQRDEDVVADNPVDYNAEELVLEAERVKESTVGNSGSVELSEEAEMLNRELNLALEQLQKIYSSLLSKVRSTDENDREEVQETNASDSSWSSEAKLIMDDDHIPFRLDPREFRHLRCDAGGGGKELCAVLRRFVHRLESNDGGELGVYYRDDASPVYYIPGKISRGFYLIANVLLHHAVADEMALPVLKRGLMAAGNWQHWRHSRFGVNAQAQADPRYPLFDDTAEYLHPVDLDDLHADLRLRIVFCMQYLLRVLKT